MLYSKLKMMCFTVVFVLVWFKMTEPSKVIHVRNVGHEISEVCTIYSILLFNWVCKFLINFN